MPYLCVYGHVALDQIMSLESFPEPNTSVDVQEKKRYFGGTGANVATVAANLGVPTALCAFVGPDFPEDFRRFLLEKAIDLRDLAEVEGYETPTVWIVSDSMHNQIAYVYQGPMRDMSRFEIRSSAASESTIIHISTGRPDYYLRLMAKCRALGKQISFDPAQEIHRIWNAQAFQEALSLCDTFFANENELRTATRYLGVQKAEDLLRFVPRVVNTRGAKGSAVYARNGIWTIPAVQPKRIVDTTGAGDAFRAGFYAAQYRGYSVEICAAFGSAAASFTIEEQGSTTNLPTWKEVRERAESVLNRIEQCRPS